MKHIILCFAFVFSLCAASGADKPALQKPLVVHEWGTFTSLQDEDGNAIGGINTDDEPVPAFVHRLAPNLVLDVNNWPRAEVQGAPQGHPDVTMRLETPVMYFYPPKGWKAQPVDVHVTFVGGWLTEFYPAALAKAPGLDARNATQGFEPVYPENWNPEKDGAPKVGALTDYTRGELTWKGLTLNAPGTGPKTTAKVWLAPRDVKSAMVKNDIGESERFLFYRGVGHADAPLSLVRSTPNGPLQIRDKRFFWFYEDAQRKQAADQFRIHGAWLVDVRPDATCAFKSFGTLEYGREVLGSAPGSFAEKDYSPKNMASLRAEMHQALVEEGLFADEAEAMLNTWQVSYFKSPGLRFFYICPRKETDDRLPLELSVSADVTRVMIGRIEIVTREQRALLAEIAAGPAPDLKAVRAAAEKSGSDFFKHPENVANWNDVITGKKPFSALGLDVPEVYADYLKLGRFRNALLLNEQSLRPTPALNDFITKNRLEAYKVADSGSVQSVKQ